MHIRLRLIKRHNAVLSLDKDATSQHYLLINPYESSDETFSERKENDVDATFPKRGRTILQTVIILIMKLKQRSRGAHVVIYCQNCILLAHHLGAGGACKRLH